MELRAPCVVLLFDKLDVIPIHHMHGKVLVRLFQSDYLTFKSFLFSYFQNENSTDEGVPYRSP